MAEKAEIDGILEELSRESVATRRMLERVPQEHLGWKPHTKSKSLGELAWHVAAIPRRMAQICLQDDVDVATVKAPAMPDSAAGIVESFDQQLAETREMLSGLDDSMLARDMTMRRGDRTIFAGTKQAILRTVMLNHGYHHRGQLSVYLRLLDVPLPSVYGPTADES